MDKNTQVNDIVDLSTEEKKSLDQAIRQTVFRQTVSGGFVSGKTINQQKGDLAALGSILDHKILVKEKVQKRNEQCACGSGKKFKKCCMIQKKRHLLMHRKTVDWEIVALAIVLVDRSNDSKSVEGIETTGRIFADVGKGELFNLSELDPAMSGPAETIEYLPEGDPEPYTEFKVIGNCAWPPAWNEDWAKRISTIKANAYGSHPRK